VDNNIKSTGIYGIGFVGHAIFKTFKKKGVNVTGYDKFVTGFDNQHDMLQCDIIFLCLPTKFDSKINSYDKSCIEEACKFLVDNEYKGPVIIKSTVEPESTSTLEAKFALNLIHNPEFLTARTADHDYLNQTHIVLGRGDNCSDEKYQKVIDFHQTYFPSAEISQCSSIESESMKIFANCFYSVKVQFFTELYLLCKKTEVNYELVKNMIVKNGWVSPMHTNVPGPDGEVSYGGLCFPKDTNALLQYMKSIGTPCSVLEGTIKERDTMRSDNDNCM
jgi:UDPglucose 6-dehydrogenase